MGPPGRVGEGGGTGVLVGDNGGLNGIVGEGLDARVEVGLGVGDTLGEKDVGVIPVLFWQAAMKKTKTIE